MFEGYYVFNNKGIRVWVDGGLVMFSEVSRLIRILIKRKWFFLGFGFFVVRCFKEGKKGYLGDYVIKILS